jgi:hypothetical protein
MGIKSSAARAFDIARFEAQNKHGHDPQLQHLSIYRRRNRRMRGGKLTSTHFEHGHLKAVSFGKTMWPQFSQISCPLETTVIKWNSSSRTQ